jgi:hypothetical protein
MIRVPSQRHPSSSVALCNRRQQRDTSNVFHRPAQRVRGLDARGFLGAGAVRRSESRWPVKIRGTITREIILFRGRLTIENAVFVATARLDAVRPVEIKNWISIRDTSPKCGLQRPGTHCYCCRCVKSKSPVPTHPPHAERSTFACAYDHRSPCPAVRGPRRENI